MTTDNNSKELVSFHGKKSVKKKYLDRVKAHYKADEIVKGQYWEEGKGCAIGCTIHSGRHSAFEKELGLPIWLALLEDSIFEGLPNAEAKEFPVKFLEAIPIGVNYSGMMHEFLEYLLVDPKEGVLSGIDGGKWPDVVKAVKAVAELHARAAEGNVPLSAAWSAAWSAARSAARSAAWSAAESAARSAAESAARSAARSAAWSAARSAALSGQAKKLLALLASRGKKMKVKE